MILIFYSYFLPKDLLALCDLAFDDSSPDSPPQTPFCEDRSNHTDSLVFSHINHDFSNPYAFGHSLPSV